MINIEKSSDAYIQEKRRRPEFQVLMYKRAGFPKIGTPEYDAFYKETQELLKSGEWEKFWDALHE